MSLALRCTSYQSKKYRKDKGKNFKNSLINAMGEINNELKTIITKKRRRGKVLGRVSRE
jgi:hypothetical protein